MDENEIKVDEDVMDEIDDDIDGEEEFDDEFDDDESSNGHAVAIAAAISAIAGIGGAIYYAHKKQVVKRAVAAVKVGVASAKDAFKKSATDVDVIDTVKVDTYTYIPVDDSNKKSTEK